MSDDKPVPKPPPVPELSGELVPQRVKVPPAPPKEQVDNREAEAALAFLKAGAPLQDGTPDNPNAVLAKLRKSAE
jgi:hypothetical protein